MNCIASTRRRREYFQQYLAFFHRAPMPALTWKGAASAGKALPSLSWASAPGTGRGLFNHLLKAGFEPQQMVRAGAVYQGQDGGHRDAFRGRLIIPIRNGQGELGGFGSRALDDSMPKYLNTGRTPVFDKGRTLYALHLARESARREGMVIVEGYMDAISAHQHGYQNVVASMGTALTDHQVAEVLRITRQVTMALDADAAGQQATLRSLESSWAGVPEPPGMAGGRFQLAPQRSGRPEPAGGGIGPTAKTRTRLFARRRRKWEELLRNGLRHCLTTCCRPCRRR